MKPFSTVPQPLRTVDLDTGEPAVAIKQRTDACAVPAGGVVGEAVVAFTLADVRAREVRGRLAAGDDAQPRRLPGDPAVIVYLVGMPGSGKSTVGAELAGRLGVPFVDLDVEIAREDGRSITEIFEAEGEAGLSRAGGEGAARRLRPTTPR